jgi:hypothetical protein
MRGGGHDKGIFFRIFLVFLDKIAKFGGEGGKKKGTKREKMFKDFSSYFHLDY